MKRLLILSIFTITMLGVAFPTAADTVKFHPFVFVKQEYSDNIKLASSQEESDHITTIAGGGALLQETERLSASVGGQAERLLYRDNDAKDATDYSFDGNILFQVTERFSSNVSAEHSIDTRNDADTQTTGQKISGERKSTQGNMGFGYQLSELSSANISFGCGQSDITDTNRFEDSNTASVVISFNRSLHRYFANTTGIVNFSYNHYATDTEDITPGNILTSTTYGEFKSDIFQLSAGFSKTLTETYNISIMVGGTYTDRSERSKIRLTLPSGALFGESIFPEITNDSINGMLSASIGYTDEYNRVSLSIEESMQGGTGSSGVVLRSSILGHYSRRISDEFSVDLDASCHLNQNERKTTADTDTFTFTLQPEVRYVFARGFILTCGYKFSSVEDMENSKTSKQNLVFLTIRKEFQP